MGLGLQSILLKRGLLFCPSMLVPAPRAPRPFADADAQGAEPVVQLCLADIQIIEIDGKSGFVSPSALALY